MTDSYTARFQFTLPDFNSSPWHAKVNQNFTNIDSVLYRMTVVNSIRIWTVNTTYAFGDFVIDPTDATFWVCAIGHTSRVAGTMPDDRADHPTYWRGVALSVNPRGVWVNDTQYYVGDIVTGDGLTAICIESHVSSALPNTLTDDLVFWSVMVTSPVAADIPFTPGGTVAATNVQAAIAEVASEADTRLDALETTDALYDTRLDNLEAADVTLDSRLDTAEAEIDALQADVLHNYAVNGHHTVALENRSYTASTVANYYVAEMWLGTHSHGGTTTYQNVASSAPIHSPRTFRITATVADAAVAAGDYLFVAHNIEGFDVADLLIGTANAKQITIGFYVKAPAGTYHVGVLNSAQNRGYPAAYTITGGEANVKTRKSVTLTLDTTGTWLADNNCGLRLFWTLMGGSTFQGTANQWGAGNFFSAAAQFNFMGTGGNVFELSDVVIVQGAVDPGPMPIDYHQTVWKCNRYFQQTSSSVLAWGNNTAGQVTYSGHALIQEMRTTPTVTYSGQSYGNASNLVTGSSGNTQVSHGITITASGYGYVVATAVFNARV